MIITIIFFLRKPCCLILARLFPEDSDRMEMSQRLFQCVSASQQLQMCLQYFPTLLVSFSCRINRFFFLSWKEDKSSFKKRICFLLTKEWHVGFCIVLELSSYPNMFYSMLLYQMWVNRDPNLRILGYYSKFICELVQ